LTLLNAEMKCHYLSVYLTSIKRQSEKSRRKRNFWLLQN